MDREEQFKVIAKIVQDRFGGTEHDIDQDEASIYFRAHKPDANGHVPAIHVVRFIYRADRWWLTSTMLSIPLWECLRNQCKVENY